MAQRRHKFLALIAGTTMGLSLALSSGVINATESTEKEKDKESSHIPLEDVQRFSMAVSQIKNYYVKEVKDEDLFANAIRGMLENLDPHSDYLDEKDFKDLQTSTRGEFGGLGIEVTMENGLIKVVSAIDDTPASKAGIQSGDYIVRLDSTAVKGLTLRDAVSKMRGKIGTPIKLTIVRKGMEKPLILTLKRENIQIKSVKARLIDHRFAYLRISTFQALTSKEFTKAIKEMKEQSHNQLEGMILDLRNNPGGLLDAAIEISDALLESKKGKEPVIVYTKGRIAGSEFIAKGTGSDLMNNAPLVVMINGGSASASEIVAGALKDNKRAILVGTKSFGKGSVQTILPLDNKRAIKLTTALYYTPSGISIQATGISPDIVVENVRVPESKEPDNTNVGDLTEADLAGHIEHAKPIDEKKDAKPKSDESVNVESLKVNPNAPAETDYEAKLIHTDYQLYSAINVLKGMVLSKKEKSSNVVQNAKLQ